MARPPARPPARIPPNAADPVSSECLMLSTSEHPRSSPAHTHTAYPMRACCPGRCATDALNGRVRAGSDRWSLRFAATVSPTGRRGTGPSARRGGRPDSTPPPTAQTARADRPAPPRRPRIARGAAPSPLLPSPAAVVLPHRPGARAAGARRPLPPVAAGGRWGRRARERLRRGVRPAARMRGAVKAPGGLGREETPLVARFLACCASGQPVSRGRYQSYASFCPLSSESAARDRFGAGDSVGKGDC